jgi:hypothetical protein
LRQRLYNGDREALLKGSLSTIDLLVQDSFDQLLFILKISFNFFYETSYVSEEVNGTEPSRLLVFPGRDKTIYDEELEKVLKRVQQVEPLLRYI